MQTEPRDESEHVTGPAGRPRTWAASSAVLVTSLLAIVTLAAPAAAYPSNVVSLTGHGWGHGHGMGQWGALGYALSQVGYQSIVGHYYGGTALTGLSAGQEATTVRVALTENDGNTVIVTSGSPFSVQGTAVNVAAGQAVEMVPIGGGQWSISTGGSCGGPWAFATTTANPTAVPSVDPPIGSGSTATQALQLCQLGSNLVVRGSLEGTTDPSGGAHTVDILPLEEYVAGVVPNESPAGWGSLGGPGPQGQPWGFQELEAQAVAARSYVMAGLGSYGGYADICDLGCQSYRGTANEATASDLAVTDTAGQVMEFAGGAVAATQYSASTGGYTAPGAFPAVPDLGDGICVPGACNPNHTWSTTVPVTTVESTWPQLGTLESVDVTARNGYGDWGGRVTAMTLVGSAGNVSVSGDQFAAALGLNSDWFTVTSSLGAPAVAIAPTSDAGGYWVTAADGSLFAFGDATFDGSMGAQPLNQPIVGMAATGDSRGYWMVAADGGIFSFGDASFDGSMGAHPLNQPIVGMAATPDGRGYWMVAADGGIFSFGDASFFGSMGAHPLNQPVVGMAATPDGRGYWLVAADGGIFAFGDATFDGSMGAHPLNQPVVGMSAAPSGLGYRLVAADGGIFSFGSAAFFGSTGNLVLNQPVVGMAATADGGGYWMVAADGGIFAFGDATFYGSAAG